MLPRIEFRDRLLKDGEKYHHRCTKCGVELHPDLAYSHKCVIVTKDDQTEQRTGAEGEPLFQVVKP